MSRPALQQILQLACASVVVMASCSPDATGDPIGSAGQSAAAAGSGSGTAGTTAGSGTAGQPAATSGTSGSITGAAGRTAAGTGAAGSSSSGTAGSPAAGSGASGSAAGSAAGSGSASGSGGAAGAPLAGGAGGAAGGSATTTEKFSFFVTSYAAIQRLAKSADGFGGDLRYGEKDGLAGADKICREIAETSMPGAGAKTWRAFLSVTKGPEGTPIHAIDRVGEGPWYDRLGRLVASNKTNLAMTRPQGADTAIINDLPNEDGVPNHAPEGSMQVDNHDILTGTGPTGQLFNSDWKYTCHDWTSKIGADGTPRVGHSWPRGGGRGGRPGGGGSAGGPGGGGSGPGGGSGENWMSALNEAGCAPGASLVEMGPPDPNIPTVGSGGGYGGIYCFALTP